MEEDGDSPLTLRRVSRADNGGTSQEGTERRMEIPSSKDRHLASRHCTRCGTYGFDRQSHHRGPLLPPERAGRTMGGQGRLGVRNHFHSDTRSGQPVQHPFGLRRIGHLCGCLPEREAHPVGRQHVPHLAHTRQKRAESRRECTENLFPFAGKDGCAQMGCTAIPL